MAPAAVRLRLQWSVLPQQVVAVCTAAHGAMSASRREPGCVICSLATEMGERVTITLVEEWDSQESLRRHVRSPHFETLAGLLESAAGVPSVEFTLGNGTRGFPHAGQVRDHLLHHAPGR